MCDALAPDALPPSPNAHAYVSGSLSGSAPLPAKLIAWPAVPEYGPPAFAVGGWFVGGGGGDDGVKITPHSLAPASMTDSVGVVPVQSPVHPVNV